MPSPMTGENMVHLSQKEGGLEPRSLGEWICRGQCLGAGILCLEPWMGSESSRMNGG